MEHRLKLYTSPVSAGFPSPAEDHVDETLDLNEFLITNPPATYLIRVVGDSMIGAAIAERDILVVDASLTPKHNDIVVASVDGEFTVKRFWKDKGKIWLKPENPNYSPIALNPDDELIIVGVVTGVVRKTK